MADDDESRTARAMDAARDPAQSLRAYRVVVIGAENEALTIDVASPTRLLIGQGSACHLVLADRLVSRRHAAVDLHADGVKIVDLGSTNGTRVNGVRIVEAFVEPGDRIQVGATTLRLDLAADAMGAAPSPNAGFGRVVGASVAMRRLYPLCERLAQSDLPLTIEGETGVGKELLAEAIHEAGPRRSRPFVVFDCAGVRPDDVLSRLFGDGASAGSSALEQAIGGTILLDEIAELADDAQARLVRFLDRGEVRRDGPRVVTSDARLIATSRRDLDAAVQEGRFREELFFRIAASRIELPPLRDREGDVPLLARTFWRAWRPQQPMPAGLVDRYAHYRWPGNVHELKNVISRYITLGAFADAAAETDEVARASGDIVDRVLALDLPLLDARAKVVEDFERRYLEKVLARHGGNVSRAAAASGIARRYFQILRARANKA